MRKFLINNYVGITLSTIHFIAFVLTVIYVNNSSSEQSEFIWLLWFPVDFPWSLLHLVGGKQYGRFIRLIYDYSYVLYSMLYTPYLVHGYIGTIWWFFLPKIIKKLNRRL